MPGRDRHHADAVARELAGDRQRHADEPALRGRVRRLPDLPVERRHRRGVDDHAALAFGVRRCLRHRVGGKPRHVERADQVDVDRARETRERVRPVLAEHLLAVHDAGAVDEPVQSAAEAVDRRGDRGLRARLVRDVGAHEPHAGADLLSSARPSASLRSATTTRPPPATIIRAVASPSPDAPAGDDERAALDLHGCALDCVEAADGDDQAEAGRRSATISVEPRVATMYMMSPRGRFGAASSAVHSDPR